MYFQSSSHDTFNYHGLRYSVNASFFMFSLKDIIIRMKYSVTNITNESTTSPALSPVSLLGTVQPSSLPSQPTVEPSGQSSGPPQPRNQPTRYDSREPTHGKVIVTKIPLSIYSKLPTFKQPDSKWPTAEPTDYYYSEPTSSPKTLIHNRRPTRIPSLLPISIHPSLVPSSFNPSNHPTRKPTISPTRIPTRQPNIQPTMTPIISMKPTISQIIIANSQLGGTTKISNAVIITICVIVGFILLIAITSYRKIIYNIIFASTNNNSSYGSKNFSKISIVPYSHSAAAAAAVSVSSSREYYKEED